MELLSGLAGYRRDIPERQNKLGAMRGDLVRVDEFPGVAGDLSGNEAGFVPVNPDAVALPDPEPELIQLLRIIAYNTRTGETTPNQLTTTHNTIPSTEAGERVILFPFLTRNIFISNPTVNSRALDVYAGRGMSLFLGHVPEGMVQIIRWPADLEAITIGYGTGDANDRYSVVASDGSFSLNTAGDFF